VSARSAGREVLNPLIGAMSNELQLGWRELLPAYGSGDLRRDDPRRKQRPQLDRYGGRMGSERIGHAHKCDSIDILSKMQRTGDSQVA
jgi:hypothetical protein